MNFFPTVYAISAPSGQEVAGETASEIAKLIQIVIAKIPLWIAAFIVLILTFVVARIARSMVENKLAEKGIEEEHKEIQILGGRMTYAGLLIIGITVALKIAGIDLTAIIAAGAFGIGFALKDLIMNFLAGVMILVSRHFTIGDFINVGGTIGKIVEIQARTTMLQAIDGTRVIVPNADLFKKQVTSFTSNPFRRIEILVGVDYRTNLENAVRVCMKAVKETHGILQEPKSAVLIDQFAESSINLKIRAWVDSKGGWVKVKSDLVLNIKKEFDAHGIVIPWPIRTIAYDKDAEHNEKMLEEAIKAENETQLQAAQNPNLQAPQTTPVVTAQVQLPASETASVNSTTITPGPLSNELKPLGEQV